MTDLLGGLFADFFGARPPESVARKVLGIGTTLPLNREGIKAAFRWRIKLLRPDLDDAGADALRLRHIADDQTWRPIEEMTIESRSVQEQLAELLWAREDLIRRLPPPPVTDADVPGGDISSRNRLVSSPCAGGCGKVGGGGWEYGRLSGYCRACGHKRRLEEARERRWQARADRRCEVCGVTFTPPRSDGRYCSNACRQDAYRKRKLGGTT
jgi:hypothetical protein